MLNARGAVSRVVSAVDSAVPRQHGISILIYHTVGRGGGAVDVDVDVFRSQLEFLSEHRRVIALDAAVDELRAPSPSGDQRDAVVITFDDGSDDFARHALPALVEADLPATLYARTAHIDDGSPFPWGVAPATWSELSEAASTGLVGIGCHTHTHRLLDRATRSEIIDELDRSVGLIEERLGRAPRHFAYPKAVPGSAVADALVRSRFDSATLARNRVNVPAEADLHRLWRTPVQRGDDLDRFAAKSESGARFEGELRHQLARWKYRGAAR